MANQTKITIVSVLFLLLVFIDVYAVIFQNKSIEIIAKPFLITTLCIVYLLSVKKVNFWLVSALFFSFLGDVFLLNKQNYFLFGLGSFLFAHMMYIKMTFTFLKSFSFIKFLKMTIPYLVFFVTILWIVKDNLGKMLVPVLLYGLAILTFGSLTLLNYIQEKSKANIWLLLGAILFIASDSLIAINNFYQPKHIFNISIIILYIISQFLIVKAIIIKEA